MISKENKENKTREEELKENISYIGKALGIEEEKEVKEEKNIEKEFPNLPEKSAMTWKNTDINILYDEYMKGNAVELPKWLKIEKGELKIVPQELYIYITEHYNILFVKLGNSDKIVPYLYENGYYHLWTENECKAFIKSHLPKRIRKPHDWESVYRELQTEYSNIEESELNSDESIINFKNGILNIDTKELLPHSPQYISTRQIQCNYLPMARLSQAKATIKFLNDMTSGYVDDEVTILEYIGVSISNVKGSRFKKMLILKGPGNTGKSKLLELVTYMLGVDNTFTSDIKKLHSNFGLAGIYGKRLICCGDMKFANLAEVDILKELTGGDYVNLEAKYQNSFTTKYNGLMWFNCNDLPAFSGDKGKHVYERFMIVSCDNVIPPEKRDAELLDKLKEEADILASVAVKYLIMAKNNNYTFTESERTIANRKKYEIENDSLSLFLSSCCAIGEGRTTTKEFKSRYKFWCKENKLIPEKPNNISRILEEKFGIKKLKSNTQYYELTIKELL